MTDKPYTENDLRAEAARQHVLLTEDPDFVGISEQMQGEELWDSLNPDEFDAAHRAIDGILGRAADVSDWAIDIGNDGLTPEEDHVDIEHNRFTGVRIHFAFHPSMPQALRKAVINAVRDKVRVEVDDA